MKPFDANGEFVLLHRGIVSEDKRRKHRREHG
jgi:cytochrome oxidase assembly protein ShyY1